MVKVKVMHISIANFSKMIKDRANIAISRNRRSYKDFSLAYLHLTLTHYKGQGQDHAHFDSECLVNGDRYGKHCYCHQIQSRIRPFHLHIYIWPWPVLKVKVKVVYNSNVNISQTVTDMAAVANK